MDFYQQIEKLVLLRTQTISNKFTERYTTTTTLLWINQILNIKMVFYFFN